MLKRLAILLTVFGLLIGSPVLAQSGPGYFIEPNPASVVGPRTGQTVVWDSTNYRLVFWNGVAFVPVATQGNYSATVAPTTSNDSTQGYSVGSIWIDTAHHAAYFCTDNTATAAVWQSIATGADKLTVADWLSDFLVSGCIGSVPASSLSMTTPSGVAYVTGQRVAASASTYTYPINKDVYDFLQSDGTWVHHAVANGAGQPTDTGLLIQKVVTNGTVITAVTQIALNYPSVNVPDATGSHNPVTLAQADARYIPTSVWTAVDDLMAGDTTAGTFVHISRGTNGTVFGPSMTGSGYSFYSIVGTGGITATPSGTTITIDGTGAGYAIAPGAINTAEISDGAGHYTAQAIVNSLAAGAGINLSATTGTNVTISLQSFASTVQTITSAGTLTIAHGLLDSSGNPRAPIKVWAALVNVTGEAGYSPGDTVFFEQVPTGTNSGYACTVDTTNLNIIFGSDASPFHLPNKSTGVGTALTNANWNIRFYAE